MTRLSNILQYTNVWLILPLDTIAQDIYLKTHDGIGVDRNISMIINQWEKSFVDTNLLKHKYKVSGIDYKEILCFNITDDVKWAPIT